MATLEDAIRCPKCQENGKEVKRTPGPKGSRIYVFHCQKETCKWFGTGWTVQVKADGTVPERQKGPKQFEQLSVYDEAAAKRILDELKEENNE